MQNGSVCDRIGNISLVQVADMPGFVIPVEGKPDEFVVGIKRRVVLVRWDGEDGTAEELKTLSELDKHSPDNRINDAKCDPRGRLFVGTMGHEYEPGKFHLKKGSLYRVEGDGRTTRLVDNVIKVDPNAGKLLQKVPTPALQTTSATFGGPNFDILYVTSACMNRGVEQLPPAGSTFEVTGLGVRGHPNVSFALKDNMPCGCSLNL
ncbi:unnamed protein product [Leptidea sinapis]|uniref:SMP-30/Gluconolactonase/LRE-like region domain-containing protein n=1 Tax=Leptidea sinapis TaxID=189913 RepID=A0A5E4PSI2_9NEOP|nr:unnamed protein product [Leptidea sinapis]